MPYVQTSPIQFPQINSIISGSGPVTRLDPFTVLTDDPTRFQWGVQSVGTGTVYISANGNASSSNFIAVLKPASAMWAGDGGTLAINGYTGPVMASGSIGAALVGWENK